MRKKSQKIEQSQRTLGMPSKGRRQSKISLKENSVVPFDSKKNANIFCRFFSDLVDSLLQKLPTPKSKFGIKITGEYYKQIFNKWGDFVLQNVDKISDEKILENLDVAKASGIDQISAKFLNDGAPVIAIHLANINNLWIKLDIFPWQFKIAKINLCSKSGLRLELKIIVLFLCCLEYRRC